jgi:hypothetical protein
MHVLLCADSLNQPIDAKLRPRREAFAEGVDVTDTADHHPQQLQQEQAPALAGDLVHGAESGVASQKGPGSIEAFHLMEMDNRARHVRTYRQSQVRDCIISFTGH